jgi:putative FmdB family regulatory protein
MLAHDYICIKCGEKFKVPLKDECCATSIKCPKCGAENPERVIYAQDRSGSSCCSNKHYG